MKRKFLIAAATLTLLFADFGRAFSPSAASAPPPANSAITTTQYTYDQNGNLLSDGEQCNIYNDANQLAEVRDCATHLLIAEYLYDHTGQRQVERIYEAGQLATTVYTIGDHYETVVANGVAQNISYYYANDELVARRDAAGQPFFYHPDHLGSTRTVSDGSGNIAEQIRYYPYGEIRNSTSDGKYLFTGQEYDPETGNYYYGARYYNSALARFIQADPLLAGPYDPQLLNRYSYTRNNPLRYVDPTGNTSVAVELGEELVKFLEETITDELKDPKFYVDAAKAVDHYLEGDKAAFEEFFVDVGLGIALEKATGVPYGYDIMAAYIQHSVTTGAYKREPFQLLWVYDPQSLETYPDVWGCKPDTCSPEDLLRNRTLEVIHPDYWERERPRNRAILQVIEDAVNLMIESVVYSADHYNRMANPWMYPRSK